MNKYLVKYYIVFNKSLHAILNLEQFVNESTLILHKWFKWNIFFPENFIANFWKFKLHKNEQTDWNQQKNVNKWNNY